MYKPQPKLRRIVRKKIRFQDSDDADGTNTGTFRETESCKFSTDSFDTKLKSPNVPNRGSVDETSFQ